MSRELTVTVTFWSQSMLLAECIAMLPTLACRASETSLNLLIVDEKSKLELKLRGGACSPARGDAGIVPRSAESHAAGSVTVPETQEAHSRAAVISEAKFMVL